MSIDAFQNWVVQTGLVVSLLILVILVIRRPFARVFGANAAYALWSLPLIRLCLPGLSIPQNWVPEILSQTPKALGPIPAYEPPAIATPPINDTLTFPAPTELVTPEPLQWGVFMIGVWVSVAGLWLGYQLVQQYRFKSRLSIQSSAPDAAMLTEIRHAAKTVHLKALPNVRVSNDQIGPLVTGVFRPMVIVPNNFEETFQIEQRHFALVHEFAHIKRRDLWVALTTLIFRAINWPNPLVHFASHKLRGDQEAACDAFVVKVTGGGTAHSYAETLVKAVRQEAGGTQRHGHLALSLTETKTEISKGD